MKRASRAGTKATCCPPRVVGVTTPTGTVIQYAAMPGAPGDDRPRGSFLSAPRGGIMPLRRALS